MSKTFRDHASRAAADHHQGPTSEREGSHASEHPRDSGSVPSVDQPEAGDSGALGERIDIRQLDFVALKAAGYRGAVVDKDNCLTLPHHDELVPELTDAWQECRRTFGEGNVLVVSNSAGTPQYDAGGIQAESISHYLQVPVLRHKAPKPGYSCIQGVRNYFASLPSAVKDGELVVIGDRIFTDVVMANRMKSRDSGRGPLAIWTSGVWTKEAMGMRWIEKKLVEMVTKHTNGEKQYTTQFLKPEMLERSHEGSPAPRAYPPNADLFERIWKRFVQKSS